MFIYCYYSVVYFKIKNVRNLLGMVKILIDKLFGNDYLVIE